jgi:hypothetical protein
MKNIDNKIGLQQWDNILTYIRSRFADLLPRRVADSGCLSRILIFFLPGFLPLQLLLLARLLEKWVWDSGS